MGMLLDDQAPEQSGRADLEQPIERPLDYTHRAWPYETPTQHAEAPIQDPTMPLPFFMVPPMSQSRTAAFGPPWEVRPGYLPRQYAGPGLRINMKSHPGIGVWQPGDPETETDPFYLGEGDQAILDAAKEAEAAKLRAAAAKASGSSVPWKAIGLTVLGFGAVFLLVRKG